MQPPTRLRALAGVATPPLFVVVLVALTIAERGFLGTVGWSAVHRTKVEWPSLLALGRYGWLMIATFIVAGLCGLGLATAIWSTALTRAERVAAVLVGVMSVAIALEAFRPDSPSATGGASWHDAVHNGVFPAIPVASLGATAAAAYSARRAARAYLSFATSLVLLALMALGLGLTNIVAIAQLARYLYLGALLVWVELVALGTLRRTREASPDPTLFPPGRI